jgi:hypothetical protein
MDPLSIASLTEGGIGVLKSLFGSSKSNTPLPVRPKYTAPNEIDEILQREKIFENSDLPGYSTLESKLAGSTAKGAKRIGEVSSDSSQAIAAITGLYSNEMAERADLDVKNAQYKMGQRDALNRALQTKADYKDKEWNWNEAMKYQDQFNMAMADRGAGNEMLGSGLSDITGAASGYATGKLWEKALAIPKSGDTAGQSYGGSGTPLEGKSANPSYSWNQ